MYIGYSNRQSIRQYHVTYYCHAIQASMQCPHNYLLIQRMRRQCVPGPIYRTWGRGLGEHKQLLCETWWTLQTTSIIVYTN